MALLTKIFKGISITKAIYKVVLKQIGISILVHIARNTGSGIKKWYQMHFAHHRAHGYYLIIICLLYDPHSCLYITLLEAHISKVLNIGEIMLPSILMSILEYESQLVDSVVYRIALLDNHFMIWYCYPIVLGMLTKVRITAANMTVDNANKTGILHCNV